MRTKFNGILTLILAFVVQASFAQMTITGTVKDDMGPIPGASVLVKGTTNGTVTDFDGNYSITANTGDVLVFSMAGNSTEKTVGTSNVINAIIGIEEIDEVVVTALGITRKEKTLTYSSQKVKTEELNITQDNNIKTAIAGKVSGVQMVGQAGSKLGESGKIRIRGAISLVNDSDPLYVLDGVPISDPNDVDMSNVASVTVLKGPNATALYGQRADSGVIVLTSIKGGNKLSVTLGSTLTYDNVAYLPNYQNEYGQGYERDASWATWDHTGFWAAISPAEWSVNDGKRHLSWDNNYADESWGPKFDGQDYAPWYSWWPGTADNPNPYYGQTAKYEAQPDNIKDFYNTGISFKNNVAISGGGDNYTARLSYSDLNVEGIIPDSNYKKQFVNSYFTFNPSERIELNAAVNLSMSDRLGDFDDGYGNQTSGSFNSWFGRDMDMNKMRELKDLKNVDGYSASWNWWGPEYYAYVGNFLGREGFKKPAFWYNPYTWLENYTRERKENKLSGKLSAAYKITDKVSIDATFSRYQSRVDNGFTLNSTLSNSAAPELYNARQNSFGQQYIISHENNFSSKISYANSYENFDFDAFVGGNIRTNKSSSLTTWMDKDANSGGLVIPDVYDFRNASEIPVTSVYNSKKQVNSLYGKASFGYKKMLYIDATYRKDWSSALRNDLNGYGYPSLGASFILSELLDNKEVLSFVKLRANWGQVGNDVSALLINPNYSLGTKPLGGSGSSIYMYNPNTIVDPNLTPALNTSIEFGVDMKFFKNRMGLNVTYYDEVRTDEIIPVSISSSTGYTNFLTNAGESERKGIEISFNAKVFKKKDGFNWTTSINYGQNNTTVNALPNGLNSMAAPGGVGAFGFVSMQHNLGDAWGQLYGTKVKVDSNGTNVILSNGKYDIEPNQYLGSVLPDFTGGFVNNFSYKNLSLVAAIDFQKGGKFFSLSEMWGTYTGLYEETAGLNDLGNPKRDDVASGGGVHVTGVDTSGAPVDTYIDANEYYAQWYSNRIADPFVHDASFIKLREVGLNYSLPSKWFNKTIKGFTVGLVVRNAAMLSLSKENVHGWDPSELANTYGENGQLPGTRSYGMNIKIKL